MPTYKLIYGNGKGRAESSRMLFALADVEYEDVRQDNEEWQKMKPDSPFGQRPLLQIDSMPYICQSRAIERFLAKRFNFYGSNDVEQARVDMFIDCLNDIESTIFGIRNAENKEEAKEKLIKEAPTSFKYLEKMLSSGDYYLGNEISWADIALLNTMQYFRMMGIDTSGLLEQVPKLKALIERVPAHPKIAEWIKKRPVTQF